MPVLGAGLDVPVHFRVLDGGGDGAVAGDPPPTCRSLRSSSRTAHVEDLPERFT